MTCLVILKIVMCITCLVSLKIVTCLKMNALFSHSKQFGLIFRNCLHGFGLTGDILLCWRMYFVQIIVIGYFIFKLSLVYRLHRCLWMYPVCVLVCVCMCVFFITSNYSREWKCWRVGVVCSRCWVTQGKVKGLFNSVPFLS